jgi:hypothetical protein
MPRAPGRIFADGPRELAEGLVAALRAPTVDRESADSLTHPLHTYPARLHPATARVLVELIGPPGRTTRGAPPATFVDPFCGSGTVLVEARAANHRAVGVDLNPLAVLVARAKTWTAPHNRRKHLRERGHGIAGAVLAAGKAARRASAEPVPERRPVGFDPNARNRRLARWYAPHVRRELELIAAHLDELRTTDAELAEVLTACLSAILYKVSSRTSDTDPTWVERHVARGQPARLFAQRVELLAAGLADLPQGPPGQVFEHDARALADVIPDGSATAIITSPPYAGTYDYAEQQRLRFDFLGLRHRAIDDHEIGSRRSFERDPDEAAHAWRTALADALAAITRCLAPGAPAAIVIGDSVASRRALYALDDVRAALSDALVLEAWASQHRPMLGAGERRAFGDRPKSEHVILLRRR